jgi:hypothetical protein
MIEKEESKIAWSYLVFEYFVELFEQFRLVFVMKLGQIVDCHQADRLDLIWS